MKMKKTYIEPSVKAVEIKLTNMVCTSMGMNETPSTSPTPSGTLSMDTEFEDDFDNEF